MVFRSVLAILFITRCFCGHAQLTGDELSLQVVSTMLENLGGKDLWKKAKAIEVHLDGHYIVEEIPWKEQFWLDFEEPRGKYIIKSETTDRLIAWDMTGGWEINNGNFAKQEPANHKTEIAYYWREPTVMFNRLAKDEETLLVQVDTTTQITKLNILDKKSKENICTFYLNKKREPVFWTAFFNNRQYKRILGPLKNYNNGLRMFEWGTTENGSWRYIHSNLILLNDELKISFNPPEKL